MGTYTIRATDMTVTNIVIQISLRSDPTRYRASTTLSNVDASDGCTYNNITRRTSSLPKGAVFNVLPVATEAAVSAVNTPVSTHTNASTHDTGDDPVKFQTAMDSPQRMAATVLML